MISCECVWKISQSITDENRSEENQEYSPLLKLPGELRNKIYSFVADSGPAQAVPLHLICRQIYHEAKPFNFSLSECAVAAQNLSRKLRMKGLGPYRISSRV